MGFPRQTTWQSDWARPRRCCKGIQSAAGWPEACGRKTKTRCRTPPCFLMAGTPRPHFSSRDSAGAWLSSCTSLLTALFSFPPTPAVIYKTSLLHLQPRQMTIYLPEVRKISMDYVNLPVFNPNVFSEDEDDLPGVFLGDRDGGRALSSRGLQHVHPCPGLEEV